MKIRRRRRRYPGDGDDERNGSHGSDRAPSTPTPTPTATTPENRKSVSKANRPPAHTPDRSKSTASQTELRTKLGEQEKDAMGEAKGRRNGGDGNTAIPGKYGGPSESFPVEMSVADRYEAGREGRRTPIDFKVTKTGDFGGFSVTKTEEVDPINGFSVTRTEVDPARGRVVVSKAGEGQRSSSGGPETSSGRQGLSRRVNQQDKLSPEAKASTSKAEEPSPRLRHRDPGPESSTSKRERGKMEDKGGGSHAGDKTPGRKENPDGKEETPDKARVPQDDLESKLSRQVGSATVKPSAAERSRSKTQTNSKTQQKTSDNSSVTLRNPAMTPLSSTNGPLPPPTLRIHSRSSTLYPEANKTKQTQHVGAETEEKVDVDASIFDLPVDEAGPESRLHYQREMPDRRRPPTAAPTRVFPVELLDEVEEQNPLPEEEEERRREKNLPKSTTLSSVFSEELIPPLPNQWDDDWRNAGPSRGDAETESDSDDVPPYESGDRQPPDIHKEKQRTTKYQESPKASGGATGDRRRAEVRPAIGKADLRASSWPGPGERVEFVTVVPGGHWDVWGGPTLWDSLTPHSNNSHTNPQVYSVYWGDTGGPGSPPGWPEGVWVIRGGSLLAIMALVVTISVQVARDGPAHRAVPTAADALARAHHSQHATLATNLATSLASAHVLLIFGIQETFGGSPMARDMRSFRNPVIIFHYLIHCGENAPPLNHLQSSCSTLEFVQQQGSTFESLTVTMFRLYTSYNNNALPLNLLHPAAYQALPKYTVHRPFSLRNCVTFQRYNHTLNVKNIYVSLECLLSVFLLSVSQVRLLSGPLNYGSPARSTASSAPLGKSQKSRLREVSIIE
ncbi:uncharacterized protein LOC119590910 [Penaeus monodon]|uniref:uncharacterized protein LOC119590910 n=1 Tax=Penaeus monodon TaxID=6687 RepID=UPI0018A6E8E3|nr:uncharacterized protein LOC119590910 [Penaeus monodon]